MDLKLDMYNYWDTFQSSKVLRHIQHFLCIFNYPSIVPPTIEIRAPTYMIKLSTEDIRQNIDCFSVIQPISRLDCRTLFVTDNHFRKT